MKAMETLQDLIEEAKIRTVWWALVIFAVSYFLSHTSKSMWMNIPISILLVSGLRILTNEVELRWRVRPVRRQTYLSHLEKEQLSLDDPHLSFLPPPSSKWTSKIDSPLVEAALDELINKILQEFVIDLWYSSITPDREAPEQIRLIITNVIGEISGRVKQINLVELLTRDMVDLIGDHLDLYRKNQSAIGADVMATLSCEEKDERLKHYLMASKNLHPALISPECEYKVLQRLMGGVLSVVLSPAEAQCPLVQCISREFLTCLVMQPVMNFASPVYINELIEHLFLAANDGDNREASGDQSADGHHHDHSGATGSTQGVEPTMEKKLSTSDQPSGMILATGSNQGGMGMDTYAKSNICMSNEDRIHPRPADWARVLEAATQRRTQVLAPENIENMWTKGRNYKNKAEKLAKAGSLPGSVIKPPGTVLVSKLSKEMPAKIHASPTGTEDKANVQFTQGLNLDCQFSHGTDIEKQSSQDLNKGPSFGGEHAILEDNTAVAAADKKNTAVATNGKKAHLKRSNSTSSLNTQPDVEKTFIGVGGCSIISEDFYSPNSGSHKEDHIVSSNPDVVFCSEGLQHAPKLKCRVVGAYFEKHGSKSFAVYSIAVTDAEKNTWFVKRRYSNFERLHRHLKDIPNYTLHLPPKRFLSSSTDDSFVHQRCIQLDKYLQDLLSIANVAEQHEVWDFLSVSSKNYSFGKSTSVMRTLAVNVDDAMDDIVRQFKGVSDGLMRRVVGSPSLPYAASPSIMSKNFSLSADDISRRSANKPDSSYNHMETSHCLSDLEESLKNVGSGHGGIGYEAEVNGWHSDNELNSKGFPPRVVKRRNDSRGLGSAKSQRLNLQAERIGSDGYPLASSSLTYDSVEDPVGVPPEWTPPNVSVPLLNLVDNIFQLKRRGWLRRQVLWISKQILQLMMEDSIDDWLLRQIYWLRRDDVIAQGIRWVQDRIIKVI
ncbi:PREDICTED: uncharacterized protein LOC104595846 isoform X2 [Nelumbo nucifera]|uniref:Uncharacterized protein LOC104595846 isoform X2 n=1 Tax=Nelumbo nucifera TaxID=4432 RepID=A0A1U8A0I9_NELNU|nr:PREDICTED: uncharacterized protein LOC104595846 isoform X2 [Nelumbo nucifera]